MDLRSGTAKRRSPFSLRGRLYLLEGQEGLFLSNYKYSEQNEQNVRKFFKTQYFENVYIERISH
jgi:hypothetical protein